jgi:hypothetical protein
VVRTLVARPLEYPHRDWPSREWPSRRVI